MKTKNSYVRNKRKIRWLGYLIKIAGILGLYQLIQYAYVLLSTGEIDNYHLFYALSAVLILIMLVDMRRSRKCGAAGCGHRHDGYCIEDRVMKVPKDTRECKCYSDICK